MKNTIKKTISAVLSIIMLFSLCVFFLPQSSMAYTSPVEYMRIGLSYGSSAKVYETVSNVSGYGEGFELGYYGENNEFIPIEVTTSETSLTFAIDKNLFYDSTKKSYEKLTDATYTGEVIGCYHIQLSTVYETYEDAIAAADTFTSYHAFPKYSQSGFLVCVGSFRNSADARTAAEGLSINSEYTINSGTTYTVTVLKTGTSEIFFEFDCANEKMVGVKPVLAEGETLTKYGSYKYYGSFRFHRVDGGNITSVNVVDLENYVRCSVPYESYPSWPVETLKAQAIAARNYAATHLNNHKSNGFDLCSTSHCQTYYGNNRCSANSNQAVDETKGQFLLYNGKLCETYYTDSNGGASESIVNVWGSSMTTYAYLKGKIDPYEAAIVSAYGSGYTYKKQYTGKQLTELLQDEGYSCGQITNCEVTKTSDVGNPIEVTFTDINGRTFKFTRNKGKQVLSCRSQRFTITNNRDELASAPYVDGDGRLTQNADIYAVGEGSLIDRIISGDVYAVTDSGIVKADVNNLPIDYDAVVYTITGTGNGHNVGLSQWGSYAMCKYYNKNYIEILQFYYDGAEIVTAE